MEVLTAQLKEQAAQIQKVSAQLEARKPAPRMVINNLCLSVAKIVHPSEFRRLDGVSPRQQKAIKVSRAYLTPAPFLR